MGLSLDYVFDNSDWGDLLTKHPELIPKGMDAADAKAMVEPEAFPEIAERLRAPVLPMRRFAAYSGKTG